MYTTAGSYVVFRDTGLELLAGEEGTLSGFTVITGTAELSSSGNSFNSASTNGERDSAGRMLKDV